MARKKKLDDLMEAITFAEVGELDTASEIAARAFRDDAPQRERILAVSRAPGFSRKLAEQAVEMAARLGYGVIGLTVSSRVSRLVSGLRRPARDGGWLTPDDFRARAAERGIPFVHAAGAGDPEAAVVAVTRRFRRIAFLLVEPAHAPRSRFASVTLPVFFLEER